jgi:TonB-dependent receptor
LTVEFWMVQVAAFSKRMTFPNLLLSTFARRFRTIFAFALVTVTTGHLSAQTTGTLTGRVTDVTTQLALAGSRVTVVGTPLETFTNQAGYYTLTNVPLGRQTVEFGYVGYSDLRLGTEVAAGGRATVLDATFGSSDIVKLDKMVITGSAVGAARAINQQRAAESLTNIVAADEIGRFPDQNAAESMQRIPGLALYRDQGEGRFIVVRGIRPDLNGAQLNGINVASPDRGARTMPLDVLPTDALGAVEVTKVPMPDQEMDGLGGRINLRTRSPFDAQGRQLQLSAQGQYNNLRQRFSGKYNGTYSDVFNQGTIGVIFTPTWQDRRFGSDNFEVSNPWVLRAVPGSATGQQAFFNQDINYREYQIRRVRYGANGSVEFKPDPTTLVFVRATYSHFVDGEYRYVTTIPFSEGTLTALSDVAATVTGVRRENKQLRIREKAQDLYAYSAGFEKRLDDWQLDGRVGYSDGEDKRKEESVIFRKSTRGTDWGYDFSKGTYNPVVTQVTGPSISDPALFDEFNQLRSQPGDAYETELNIGGNARRSFRLNDDLAGYVKVGAQYRNKEKFQNRERINWATIPGFTFASLAEPQTADDYRYFTGPRIGAANFTRAFINNKSAFTGTRDLTNSAQDDWTTTEQVTAAYGLAALTLDQTTLSSGVRWERTEFEAKGNELRTTTGVLTATPGSRTRNYDNYLPGVYLRTTIDKHTVVRASISSSLARPAFGDSAFRRAVNDDTRTVTESNPGLKALQSRNYDVSVERYFQSLGMISVSGFVKEIKDFTYQATLPGVDPATGYTLTSFVNGPRGNITGLELAWQQQLRFLPSPFDGLALFANYTRSSSKATYLRSATNTFENAPFIGQSSAIGNVALSYEKKGLFVRLALNFRNPRLREDEPIGASAAEDRYVDFHRQLDLTASYKVNRNWEVFGEVLNLTNEPFRVAFGEKRTRFLQFEEYDWSANFGVRWKL